MVAECCHPAAAGPWKGLGKEFCKMPVLLCSYSLETGPGSEREYYHNNYICKVQIGCKAVLHVSEQGTKNPGGFFF